MDLPADCPFPALECAADRISAKNKELNQMRKNAPVVLGLLWLAASAWLLATCLPATYAPPPTIAARINGRRLRIIRLLRDRR